MTGSLIVAGCSNKSDSEVDTEGQDTSDTSNGSGGDGCVDDATFFSEKIWGPILQEQCKDCHNASGVAKDSKLVLVGSEYGPTYLDHNRSILQDTALNQRDGVSLLLLKPRGEVNHGGGEIIAEGSEQYGHLEEFIARISNPVTCDNAPEPERSEYTGMRMLDDENTLRKATLSLAGRLPTQGELDVLTKDPAQGFDRALDMLMEDEAFYDRLVVLFNDYFLTDLYLPGQDALALLDQDDYPDAMWHEEIEDDGVRNLMRSRTNRAVAREALELIVYIVRNHRSFEEVLTADYTVVNPYSARVYGIEGAFMDPSDPEEFIAAKIPNVPHAGVLTSSMFMNRFPTTETNRNRHRAKIIYRFFLATDVEGLASRPLDPTTIADHNPTLNNPSCTVCHANIDPMAGALQNWDAQGRYRPLEDGWYPEMRPPGFNDAVMPPGQAASGASWLAQQIVQDPRFGISIVHMVHQMLTGQPALTEPTDSSAPDYASQLKAFELQSSEFSEVAMKFAQSGYELREIFRALIKSPNYRVTVDTPLDATQAQTFTSLGTARLLTPEQLNAKIEATLGYPWRARRTDPDYLLSTRWFEIFFGGIDSDGVVQRITDPNGIMANITKRMANEMACASVARDFGLPTQERRLFPHTEISFVPKDENGFVVPKAEEAIRKNLVHLHRRLLGVNLLPNDPEIDRAFTLFVDVWTDGSQKVADETYSRALPGNCRHTRDFWTDEDVPQENQIVYDEDYTVRSWIALVAYLLSDYRFLHE